MYVACQPTKRDQALAEQYVEHREQQQCIGAGAHEQVLVCEASGLTATRVNDHDPPPADRSLAEVGVDGIGRGILDGQVRKREAGADVPS